MDEKTEENFTFIKKEANEITESLEREIQKLRDPTVHAAIIYTAVKERENANRILKNILARLDQLEAKMKEMEQKAAPEQKALADVDKAIVDYIKEHGPSYAEDVQKVFRYRGKNAACARLSRLFEFGMLKKQRTGKKIQYYAAQ